MTHIPHHKYLLWLYLRGWNSEQILDHLEEVSLPKPGPDVLRDFAALAENTPISLMAKRRLARAEFNANDLALFSKMGCRELYATTCQGTPEYAWSAHDAEIWKVVAKITENPVARVALDCAVLSGIKFDELKQLIEYSYGIQLTPEALETYQRIYFDTSGQTKSSWRGYIQTLARDPYSYVRYLAALTQPRDEVLHLVGLPTKPAFSNFLKKVLSKAEYKFTYYSGQNTGEGDDAARKWAKLGIEAGVKHEVFAKADITDFSAVLQTEFEFVEEEIPSISADMLAEIKPPSDDDASRNPNPTPAILHPDTEV